MLALSMCSIIGAVVNRNIHNTVHLGDALQEQMSRLGD